MIRLPLAVDAATPGLPHGCSVLPQGHAVNAWAIRAKDGDLAAANVALLAIDRLLMGLVAKRLRRSPWLATHEEDLRGMARRIAWEALARFDASKSSFVTFAYSCVSTALRGVSRHISHSVIKVPSCNADSAAPREDPYARAALAPYRRLVWANEEGSDQERYAAKVPPPEEVIEDRDALARCAAQAATLMRRLTPRERTVIRRRFGLDGAKPGTLDEVGAEIGVSRERVRQIQVRAVARMRGARL